MQHLCFFIILKNALKRIQFIETREEKKRVVALFILGKVENKFIRSVGGDINDVLNH